GGSLGSASGTDGGVTGGMAGVTCTGPARSSLSGQGGASSADAGAWKRATRSCQTASSPSPPAAFPPVPVPPGASPSANAVLSPGSDPPYPAGCAPHGKTSHHLGRVSGP